MSEAALAEFYRPIAEPHLGHLVLAQPEISAGREAELRYDLTTLFAEQVEGAMATRFNLRYTGKDLLGEGEDNRGMGQIFKKSLEDAKQAAAKDSSVAFEVRRREVELEEYQEILEMAAGKGPNTMVVLSEFPQELKDAKEDVGGYNIRRQQTMMRVIYRDDKGRVRKGREIPMNSLSLDGSNSRGLDAITEHVGYKSRPGLRLANRMRLDLPPERQETYANELRAVYDKSLSEQFGGEWFAGRRPADYRNTYEFVCRQTDVINECMRLDNLGWLNKPFMYKMAAELQRRFNQNGATGQEDFVVDDVLRLHQMIQTAGNWAAQNGMVFSGCGISIGSGGSSGSLKNDLRLAGYGNLAFDDEEDDEMGSLTFFCPHCAALNKRPPHDTIDNCRSCGEDVSC